MHTIKGALGTHTVTHSISKLKVPELDVLICTTADKSLFIRANMQRPYCGRMSLDCFNECGRCNVVDENFSTFRSNGDLEILCIKFQKESNMVETYMLITW